jgi:hypothetical protein
MDTLVPPKPVADAITLAGKPLTPLFASASGVVATAELDTRALVVPTVLFFVTAGGRWTTSDPMRSAVLLGLIDGGRTAIFEEGVNESSSDDPPSFMPQRTLAFDLLAETIADIDDPAEMLAGDKLYRIAGGRLEVRSANASSVQNPLAMLPALSEPSARWAIDSVSADGSTIVVSADRSAAGTDGVLVLDSDGRTIFHGPFGHALVDRTGRIALDWVLDPKNGWSAFIVDVESRRSVSRKGGEGLWTYFLYR